MAKETSSGYYQDGTRHRTLEFFNSSKDNFIWRWLIVEQHENCPCSICCDNKPSLFHLLIPKTKEGGWFWLELGSNSNAKRLYVRIIFNRRWTHRDIR